MKNQEQIIAQVQSILDNMSTTDVATGINSLQCSQGPWNSDYLIRKGYFTQEVVDFCESIDLAQENADAYCLHIEDKIESIKDNPEDWYLTAEEVAEFTDQDFYEHAECDGWDWIAYQNLVAKIFQEVKNDLED
jgi:hypothetical protein